MEIILRRLGMSCLRALVPGTAMLVVLLSGACTHKVQIEPSDKPFVVNLNVKIDHEVRHKVESQNEDLLNLEDQVTPHKKPVKKGKKG